MGPVVKIDAISFHFVKQIKRLFFLADGRHRFCQFKNLLKPSALIVGCSDRDSSTIEIAGSTLSRADAQQNAFGPELLIFILFGRDSTGFSEKLRRQRHRGLVLRARGNCGGVQCTEHAQRSQQDAQSAPIAEHDIAFVDSKTGGGKRD